MDIFKGTDRFHIDEGCTVTIGKFDGVHIGHQKLIKDVVDRAEVSGIKSCVITFENTISYNCQSDNADKEADHNEPAFNQKLTTLEEKKKLIEDMGVDILVIFDLDESFKKMNPYAFIDSVLMEKLNMQEVSIGPDFRFGHKREGKAITFVKMSMIYGYGVHVIDKEVFDGKPVSSTKIRKYISQGEIGKANRMLGRDYSVTGITKAGKKIGRSIGFPTMNIYPDEEKLLPSFGVYETGVKVGGGTYKAVTNVGVRPTVSNDEKKISVESHLLDYNDLGGNYYEKKIAVSFFKKIREEKRFSSEKELAKQIAEDIASLKQ